MPHLLILRTSFFKFSTPRIQVLKDRKSQIAITFTIPVLDQRPQEYFAMVSVKNDLGEVIQLSMFERK